MSYAEIIIDFLGCECEIIKTARDASVVMEKYETLLALGKTEGFTPLVIIPGDNLLEMIGYASENNNSADIIIESSKSIDAAEFLSNRVKETMTMFGDSGYDIIGEFIANEPTNSFNSLMDYLARRTYGTIIIAKIPTANPWELAAWVPMGGWNECPMPEEQVAIFKYWHERYGAIPAVVQGDIWEMYVENPPSTKDEAAALALEQFGFCSDIVTQGVEKVNVLASTLINAKTWCFWWD